MTIEATTDTTQELSDSPGVFTVSRGGPTDGDLAVSYTLGGSAVNGTDYDTLSGTVTIPAGQPSATIDVNAIDDYDDDDLDSEDVVATLSSSTAYVLGPPDNATVTIDEEPAPTVTIAATTDTTQELSGSPGVFTVSRSGPTDGPLTVDFAMSGTAIDGIDYQDPGASVTIPDGQASATIDVNPSDDGDGDDTNTSEAATATLSASSAYTIGTPGEATVTIDEEPTVTIAATIATTAEDSGAPGVFTITRSGAVDLALSVSYTLGGTAIDGTDFLDPGASVTIPAGQSSATVNISPIDDGDGDDPLSSESVVATLATGSYYVGAPSQATVTIDEEAPPIVSIVATTATTSETGPGQPGVFTVSRSGPTDDPLTVSYGVSGTASEGTDYRSLSGNVTIPIGQSSSVVDVAPIDDGDDDDTTPSNTVSLTLSSSSAYTIGNLSSATVTIDEDFIPTVTISASPASIDEVGGSGNFVVSLNAAALSAITVDYGVSGSAASGTDYEALSGSVVVPAGQTSADIPVTPLDDGDGDDDGQGVSITATLQSSTSYVVGSANSATMTITEDSPTPTITISATDATTAEGSGSPGAFTVTASVAPTSSLTVYYSLSGTAQNGTDYSTLSGSVTIAAGQTSATISVTPLDDGDGDDNLASESVTATLTAGTGYVVGSPDSDTVTIDEEAAQPPTVTLYAYPTATEGQPDQPGDFSVYVNSALSGDLTVYYTLGGTATNGVDYESLSGKVVIPFGQSSATVLVTPLDDGDGDDDLASEFMTATLSANAAYVIGSPDSGTVTIYEETSGQPETLSLPARQDPSATSADVAEVRAMVAAGAMRWLEAGVPLTTVIADLRGLRVAVSDLPGSIVGEALPGDEAHRKPGEIVIDPDAAGYGWFIDRTPLDDSEFADSIAPSERQAVGNSPALGLVDLLTVVMHEMGHLFGLPELPNGEYPYDVMADTLGLSTRRFPLPGPPDVSTDAVSATTTPVGRATDEVFAILGEQFPLAKPVGFAQIVRTSRHALEDESEIA